MSGIGRNPWPLVDNPPRPARVIVSILALVALAVVAAALAPLVGVR